MHKTFTGVFMFFSPSYISWLIQKRKLVKATITELKYDSVKTKLIKIFSDKNDIPTPDFNNMHIKTNQYIMPNHTQKLIHLPKHILTMKTLNTKLITSTKMTLNIRTNVIPCIYKILKFHQEWKTIKEHCNVTLTNLQTTNNKITINKANVRTRSKQTKQTLTGETRNHQH